MQHAVFFPAHDGTPSYRLCADLDDAVRLVEHLRNVEQLDDVSVFALTPVPLAYRAYYKVEVAVPEQAGAEQQPAVEQPLVQQVPEQVVEQPVAHDERPPVEDAELPPLVTVDEHARDSVPADLGFFAS